MTQTQQTPPSRESTQPADPLATLHRMSTTAGVGTAEYVAVNTFAVTSVVFGLVSFLCLFHGVLLAIPVIAIGAAIFGWVQISQSNGTQTGRLLCVFALLLGLGTSGFALGTRAYQGAVDSRDEKAIVDLIGELNTKVLATDFKSAYGLFSEKFKETVTADTFDTTWKRWTAATVEGQALKVTRIFKDALVEFTDNKETGERSAITVVTFLFTGEKPLVSQEFRVVKKADGTWLIDNLPKMFEVQKVQRGNQ